MRRISQIDVKHLKNARKYFKSLPEFQFMLSQFMKQKPYREIDIWD